MAQILNFKRLEVNGATKEEALSKAPFNIMGDATQAYKIWRKNQKDGITDSDKKQFMLDYLAKKSKNVTGVGFYITVESAVADTRERPYRIKDVKNEKGTRKYQTTFVVYDNNTGAVLGKAVGTKAKAKALTRKLYENGLTNGITCEYTRQVVEGQPIAFTAEYTPSKSSRKGTYLVFGICND
jgi:hypothetical protein